MRRAATAAPFGIAASRRERASRRASRRLKKLLERAHRAARWRHGHDDPAPQARRSRIPRRALPRLRPRPQGQQRPAGAHAAGRDRAASIASISRPARTSSRRTRSTRRPISQADYGMEALVPELNYRAAQIARQRRGRARARQRRAGVRRRRARADEPHVLAVAGRERSRVPQRHLRSSSSSRIPRRRARCCCGGVDLLLIETIFDTLNAKAAIFAVQARVRGARRRGADHHLRHDHRCLGPHAVRPDDRSVLEFRASCEAARRRPELRARRRGSCVRTCRSCRASPTRYVCAYPNAGLPNAFGEYDETPQETAEILREFADVRHAEHRRRLLRHDARAHPPDPRCR